jgi:hypothetical protein
LVMVEGVDAYLWRDSFDEGGQAVGVVHFVDVVLLRDLGGSGCCSEPQRSARVSIGNPEGQVVCGDIIGDGAVSELYAGQVEEAAAEGSG